MNPPADTEFALILERDSPKLDAEIGRLLAPHLRVPPADAIARVRYGGGLIADGISSEAAEMLIEKLRALGVRARRIEAGLWLAGPGGYKVTALEFLEDTLLARLATGESLVVPREEILGLTLYGLLPAAMPGEESEVARGRRGSARPGSSGRGPDIERLIGAEGSEPALWSTLTPRGRTLAARLKKHGLEAAELHLTLYCLEPVGALRLRKKDFDYSCLREEKQEHSLDNFLLLVEKLLKWLPKAWNRQAAEEFLSDPEPTKILLYKEEEAANFDRWMLQWVRLEAEGREGRGGGR